METLILGQSVVEIGEVATPQHRRTMIRYEARHARMHAHRSSLARARALAPTALVCREFKRCAADGQLLMRSGRAARRRVCGRASVCDVFALAWAHTLKSSVSMNERTHALARPEAHGA